MTSTEVRDEITRSGLRGRGGAGYPTGLKWTTVAKAEGAQKYVICNADEGDPGAFMDRSVLESDPYRVLEGMAIAAFAVHATEGYIYCRAEYPLAVARLRTAIRQAQRAGWLGAGHRRHLVQLRRPDPPRRRRVRVRRGDRAHRVDRGPARHARGRARRTRRSRACGTAPPSSTTSRRSPTCRRSSARAPDWYAGIGIGKSKGTKVFALAGRIVNTGLVEVPMGMTLREIVFDIGGGIIDGRPVQGRPDRRPVGRLHPGRAPRHAGQLRVARSSSARSWARAA